MDQQEITDDGLPKNQNCPFCGHEYFVFSYSELQWFCERCRYPLDEN